MRWAIDKTFDKIGDDPALLTTEEIDKLEIVQTAFGALPRQAGLDPTGNESGLGHGHSDSSSPVDLPEAARAEPFRDTTGHIALPEPPRMPMPVRGIRS